MLVEVKPRLNKLLKERNMTQNDLSIKTGITQPVISRFDKNGQHRSTHLYLISRALNVKMDDLFEVTILGEDKGDYTDETEAIEYIEDNNKNDSH